MFGDGTDMDRLLQKGHARATRAPCRCAGLVWAACQVEPGSRLRKPAAVPNPRECYPLIEPTISLSRALAWASWTISVLLFVSAWIAFGVAHDQLGIMLGLTGILFLGAGAVLTVRGWVGRVCQVVRATSRPSPTDGVVHLH